ncbi:MAG: hypothetical protein ACXVAN_14450 [Polyangia bacterium]
MSALTEVTISCPHCRRQYNMKIDPERLQRLKTRATCGRCGKTFDAASRIAAAQQQQHAPLAPPDEPKPAREPPPAMVQLKPMPRTSGVTAPDLRDEMEELAREFAEAAARFTPVGIKRSSIGLGAPGAGSPGAGSSGLEASPPAKPPAVEEPTNPGITPAVLAAKAPASSAATTPDLIAIPAARAPEVTTPTPPDQFPLDAAPVGDEEFATQVPTLSRVPTVPRSWLEQSDPGLAALQSPPSPGAAALEALFNESETIALPPPPAAS